MKLITVRFSTLDANRIKATTTYFNNRLSVKLPFRASNGVTIVEGEATQPAETPNGLVLQVRGSETKNNHYKPGIGLFQNADSSTKAFKSALRELVMR